MAEVFVPSTTGEGQGAAQIFQSNPQFADASGIVRGIERGEARIAANQEKEYERQKAESAERRKKINELQELQYGGSSEFLRSVSDSIMDDFRKAVIDNGEDVYEAFSKARVGFERVKNADTGITKVAGLVNENVDNYRAFVDGKWTTGTLYEIEKAKSKHEGDWEEELTKYENELANFGNNNANMVDAGVSLERVYLQDKKAAEADEITKQTLLDNGDIEISKTITPKNKQERRDLLLNNPKIQRSVLNEVKLQYGVSTQEEVEKVIGMPFPQYLKQKVDKLFEEEDRVIKDTKLPKEYKGNKGITEQDLAIAKEVKEAVNAFQDAPSTKESREGLNTFLAPYNLQIRTYEDYTPSEAKDLGLNEGDVIFRDNDGKSKSSPLKSNDADAIYRVIAKAAPDVKLEALGMTELTDPTPEGTIPEITETEKTKLDSAFKALDNSGLTKAPMYLDELGIKLKGNWSDGYILVVGEKEYRADDEEQAQQAYLEAQRLVAENRDKEGETKTAPKVATEEDLNNLPD